MCQAKIILKYFYPVVIHSMYAIKYLMEDFYDAIVCFLFFVVIA